jgi:hypothetical protein
MVILYTSLLHFTSCRKGDEYGLWDEEYWVCIKLLLDWLLIELMSSTIRVF